MENGERTVGVEECRLGLKWPLIKVLVSRAEYNLA